MAFQIFNLFQRISTCTISFPYFGFGITPISLAFDITNGIACNRWLNFKNLKKWQLFQKVF